MTEKDMNDLSMFDDHPQVKGATPQPSAPVELVMHTEAPASWNVKYYNPDGFDCMLTLRDNSGAPLLKKANAALRQLVKDGCSPTRNGQRTNGNATAAQTQPAASVPDNDPGYCNIHQVEMKRHEKDGSHWYSHKAGEQWCKGK